MRKKKLVAISAQGYKLLVVGTMEKELYGSALKKEGKAPEYSLFFFRIYATYLFEIRSLKNIQQLCTLYCNK